MNKSIYLLDDYFTRREWFFKIRITLSNIPNFKSYVKELYNVIKFKNGYCRYFFLKNNKNYGIAEQVIKTELDYSFVSLYTQIKNQNLLSLREERTRMGKSDAELKINEFRFKRKRRW